MRSAESANPMSVPPITRTSFIMRDGDSLNDGSLPYGCQNGLIAEIQSAQLAPVGASFRRMNQVNYAHTGDTTTQLEAKKTNALINPITHYMAQAGINDIQMGMPLGDSIANVTSIMAFMAAHGIGGWWHGPFCLGELQPDGANPFDAAITAWEAAIAPIVNGTAGFAYVSLRAVWVAQEPIFNIPGPPGVSSGVLCVPAPAPPFGIHTNPTGNRLITPTTRAAVTIS
jgi:hypothetical protein